MYIFTTSGTQKVFKQLTPVTSYMYSTNNLIFWIFTFYAHNFYLSKSETMATSRFWYYSITDDENPNMIPQAMRILDQDATHADSVSKIFYGFRHHGGGFAIERYITS